MQLGLGRRWLQVLALLGSFLLSTNVLAQSLQDAKAQGLVGEQRDGYVGFVVSDVPAAVRSMVDQVNRQRRQRYQQIAQENDLTIEQVAAVAYQRAVEATQPGHFYQNSGGAWVRK